MNWLLNSTKYKQTNTATNAFPYIYNNINAKFLTKIFIRCFGNFICKSLIIKVRVLMGNLRHEIRRLFNNITMLRCYCLYTTLKKLVCNYYYYCNANCN